MIGCMKRNRKLWRYFGTYCNARIYTFEKKTIKESMELIIMMKNNRIIWNTFLDYIGFNHNRKTIGSNEATNKFHVLVKFGSYEIKIWWQRNDIFYNIFNALNLDYISW